MFGRLSWLDKRIGTGDLNPALPLWVCKTVGGTTVHWAGASLRFQEHEFRTRTVYGDIPGANLLDWPLSCEELEPLLREGRGQDGRDRHARHPAAARQQQLQGPGRRRQARRLQGSPHRQHGDQLPTARRPAGLPSDRLLHVGLRHRRQMVNALHRDSEGGGDRAISSSGRRAWCSRSTTTTRGMVTGVSMPTRRARLHEQKARAVCVAGNSVETPRLLLNSASSKFPDGLANSSGQVGRNYMRHMTGTVYAIMPGRVNFDRGTQMAGIIKDEARHDPSRGFAGGYEMETLPGFGLAGVATNTVPGAWGRDYAKVIEMYDHFAGMWLVGEDLPQAGQRRHPASDGKGSARACRCRWSTSRTTPTTSPCATMRTRRVRRSTSRSGRSQVFELPPFPSTHNMGTCRQSEKPTRRRVQQVWADARHRRTCSSPTAASSPPAGAENPTLDHRRAGDPASRLPGRPVEQEADVKRSEVPPRPPGRTSRHGVLVDALESDPFVRLGKARDGLLHNGPSRAGRACVRWRNFLTINGSLGRGR